jgi:hypothetical protein
VCCTAKEPLDVYVAGRYEERLVAGVLLLGATSRLLEASKFLNAGCESALGSGLVVVLYQAYFQRYRSLLVIGTSRYPRHECNVLQKLKQSLTVFIVP